MSDVEGLQASLEEMLQQQTAEFEATIKKATENVVQLMDEYEARVAQQLKKEPEVDTGYEIKVIDGGLWLNQEAVKGLDLIISEVTKLIDELEKT